MRKVVVSGIGILTSLGNTIESNWESMLNSKNGITALDTNLPVKIAGKAVNFDIKQLGVSKKYVTQMDFQSSMLVYCGLTALKNAELNWPDDTMKYSIGAIVGVGNAFASRYNDTEFCKRNPLWFLETYPNMALGYLSAIASLTGYGSTNISACASSTHSIGTAFKLIQSGHAKIILAGGVEDKLIEPVASGFMNLGMCTAASNPDTAMMPFDKKRNGFVIGQGACILVLEEYQHAIDRGIKPICYIVGYGASMNGKNLTDADREGISNSMKMAILDANIYPNQINYINAHGTSTISNDREESLAIKNVFGKKAYEIPINSTKSMIGHTFAACGAIESAICAQSLMHQKIHPTRNFSEGDNDCDLDYVIEKRNVSVDYCMNNNSGIGGFNATLIFSKI